VGLKHYVFVTLHHYEYYGMYLKTENHAVEMEAHMEWTCQVSLFLLALPRRQASLFLKWLL